jgi:hypothetical protein
MTPYPPKITFDEMRSSGVRGVLIYCRDVSSSHYNAELGGMILLCRGGRRFGGLTPTCS